MSEKSNFPEFEDDPTIMGPALDHQSSHPTDSNPFAQQENVVTSSVSVNMDASEATMVMEGPNLSDETTQIHDSLANPLAPTAKLFVQEGVQKDKSYPLLGDEISFGREKENTISHPDLSVSRRHFIIHYKNDKFSLEDLGSSGGTLVNNKKVSGTIKLNHNDRIQVGKTLLQFQIIDQIGKESTTSDSPIALFAIIALLIFGGGGTALFFLTKAKAPPVTSQADSGTKRTEPPPIENVLAKKMLQRGVRLKTEGKLNAAKNIFEKVKMLSKPGDFIHLQATSFIGETEAELEVTNLLKTAENQYKQNAFKKAKELVEKAEEKLPIGSTYAELVWSLAFKISLKIDGKGVGSELKRAKKMARRRRYKQALALLANLQRAVEPGSKNAQTLIDLNAKINRRYHPKPAKVAYRNPSKGTTYTGTTDTGTTDTGTTDTGTTDTGTTVVVEPAVPAISQGLLYFTRGKLKEAETAFATENKPEKSAEVKKFGKKYIDGRSAYAIRNPAIAIPSLSRAYELDRSICGGKSIYTKQIKIMLANMFYAKGREAFQLRNFNGYGSAFVKFRRALQYQRGHNGSKMAIKRLRKLAEGWLGVAKTLGNSNKARRYLRNVQRVVYKSDSLYKKAKKQLKQSGK